jgi:DNA-directed RNA polymerase specialized sigma24 family protein
MCLRATEVLPAAQREAFLLQQEGDLSVEKITAATGISGDREKPALLRNREAARGIRNASATGRSK